jgi:hypothetical protein
MPFSVSVGHATPHDARAMPPALEATTVSYACGLSRLAISNAASGPAESRI